MFKKHKDISSLVGELVELLNKHNLSEIEYERNGERVKISNAKGGAIIAGGVVAGGMAAPVAGNTCAASGNANASSESFFPSINCMYPSLPINITIIKNTINNDVLILFLVDIFIFIIKTPLIIFIRSVLFYSY